MLKSIKKPKEFVVIAHNIRSLYNVGSIFRTADAFGVTKIYLTGYTGTPENPIHEKKIGKVALGAEKYLAWEYQKVPQIVIRRLLKDGFKIVALENNLPKKSKIKLLKLNNFKAKFPIALVLGEEVNGIPKSVLELCGQAVEIPMYGKKESLNVSVAFGVCAYEVSKSL